MHADQVQLSWDNDKSKWLVRIVSGEEVIRRYCDLPRNEAESSLRNAALTTVRDEGFEPDADSVQIVH